MKFLLFATFLIGLSGCASSDRYRIDPWTPEPTQEHQDNWRNLQGVWRGVQFTRDGLKRVETVTNNADGTCLCIQRYYDGGHLVTDQIIYSKWGVVDNILFDTLEKRITNGKTVIYHNTDPHRFFAYRIISLTDREWEYESLRSGERYLLKRLKSEEDGNPGSVKPISISRDDPIQSTLLAWKKKIAQRYDASIHTRPMFGSWSEISSKSLKELFPEYRFFTISWNEAATVGGKGDMHVSRAVGLYSIFAWHPEKSGWTEFYGFGNYEEYGQFLSQQQILLESEDDARLIWECFCDIHQKHWKMQGVERRGESVWHLGATVIDNFRYYYQIDVDKSGKVVSANLHAEEL